MSRGEEVFSRRRCGGLCGRPSSLRRGKPPHTLPPRPRKPTLFGTSTLKNTLRPPKPTYFGTGAPKTAIYPRKTWIFGTHVCFSTIYPENHGSPGTDICLSPAYPQIAGFLGTNAGFIPSVPAISRLYFNSSVGDVPMFGPSQAKKGIFAGNLRFSGTSPTVWRLWKRKWRVQLRASDGGGPKIRRPPSKTPCFRR